MSYGAGLARSQHHPQMSMSVSMPLSSFGAPATPLAQTSTTPLPYPAAASGSQMVLAGSGNNAGGMHAPSSLPMSSSSYTLQQQQYQMQRQQQQQQQQQPQSAKLKSDYHNRLRFQQNALLVQLATKDDDGNDSDDDDMQALLDAPGRRPRRLAAVRAMNSNMFDSDRNTSTPPPLPKQATAPQRKPARHPMQTNHAFYMAFSRRQRQTAAQHAELLIPITIDLDVAEAGGFKYRDAFLWNLREQLVPPEKFAEILCHDMDLPPQKYAVRIATMIRVQVEEYLTNGGAYSPYDHADASMDDARVVIELDVPLGNRRLRDRFEWDLYGGMSPEDFGKTLCADLGLPSEYVPLVGVSIRDQLARIQREYGMGLGSTTSGVAYSAFAAALGGSTRAMQVSDLENGGVCRAAGEASSWGPVVLDNSTGEYNTEEETRNDREARRNRRDNLKNDTTQYKEAEAQSSQTYIRQVERRLAIDLNLASYMQYVQDPDGTIKARGVLPKMDGLQDEALAAGGLDAGPDIRPRMMAVDGSGYDAGSSGGDTASSFQHSLPFSLTADAHHFGSSGGAGGSLASLLAPQAFGDFMHGQQQAFLLQQQQQTAAHLLQTFPYQQTSQPQTTPTSNRGGWRGRNTDGKPDKLPDRCQNRYGKAMTVAELEAWHCDWCKLDGSRTLNLRKGPRGQKTLCNACGIRYCVDNKLPDARKDLFSDLYRKMGLI
ncbi:Chromatin structure remodeling complex protein sfh1 [Sorochytrium milnesiophthora]